jgi:two-component system sensor histidine kinase RegB
MRAMRIPLPVHATDDTRPAAGDHADAGARNMQQLVLLRWIAVAGQLLAIAVVHYGFRIHLPLGTMLLVLGWLAAFNLASMLYQYLRPHSSPTALLLALLVDVAALTAQLYLSGGIANPFVFLYLLQVVLGTVLLPRPASWLLVAVTSLCVAGLALWHGPVVLPANPRAGLSDPYVQGLLACFLMVAALLVVFIGRIGNILRARDARLAAMRQRAAEEEHIVRMGLLASGAAHELGTPLSTLAVILGDWRRLPQFASDPELLHDVGEMQAQVLRCKAIVTGILQSAGETRGEAPRETGLRAFLDGSVAEWRGSRATDALAYTNRVHPDAAIIADAGLQQMLFNVLDNAFESSPAWLSLDAALERGALLLRVSDRGAGFPPGMVERLGAPYQSSKDAPGRGLGLFLSINVARALGGNIRAENLPAGGARVTISLPLQALQAEGGEDAG